MINQKLYELKKWNRVIHTTWNPDGPGVIRIHLIPPKFHPFKIVDSLAVLNGQDILPIQESRAILLTEFIDNVNKFGDGQMTDEDLDKILKNTVRGVKKVYRGINEERISRDLDNLVGVFEAVARGEEIESSRKPLTIGEYAPYMSAPHRMDLMVSAMTKGGHWNCNQKCVHCYAAGQVHSEEEELSTDGWKKIIDILRKEKVSQVTFTGGEPTMRDDIPELIKYARWFVTRLNTNGIKLTEQYCKELRDAELDSVQVTFYSQDPKIHNRLVGADQFEKTVSGIKNALAAGINLSVNTPLCTLNKDYKKTLEYLHSLGVMYVTCSGIIPTGNAETTDSTSMKLKSVELLETLIEATEFAYSHDMEISFTSPGWIGEKELRDIGLEPPSCGACLSNMAITPSGNVVPCQSWLSDDTLGNILVDGWKDIWNSDKCFEIRRISAKMEQKCQLGSS